jgi:hypothetical protein
MRLNWEYFSKRRRVSLEQFIFGASSLVEAKEIFRKRGIGLPVDGSLEECFSAKGKKTNNSVKNATVSTSHLDMLDAALNKSEAENNANGQSDIFE